MTEAKIEIRVGAVSFLGEGEDKWLSEQLDKVLDRVPELVRITLPSEDGKGLGAGTDAGAGTTITGTLAAFLKARSAATSQPRKFLATAVWIHDTEKKTRLTTSDVSKALNANNQGRLANASDCLLKNISKGFCVKDGAKQFYVTDEGRNNIGS